MAKKKVSKAQQRRRNARAAAQNTPATEMQIIPKSFQVTPGTQTPNIRFTPAEMASGNIYGTDIGNGLTTESPVWVGHISFAAGCSLPSV